MTSARRGDRDVAELSRRRSDAPARSRSVATTHAPSATSARATALADPAGGAGDQRDRALQLARRRRERQLVELERPVLDRERLLVVERDEAAERGAPTA